MRKHFFPLLVACCAGALFSCQSNSSAPAAANAGAMRAESRQYSKRHCADEAKGLCATFEIRYPVFSGGATTTTDAINQSVQSFVLDMSTEKGPLSFQAALDSASTGFIQMYKDDLKNNPDMVMGYDLSIRDTIPLLNTKVATVQMDGFMFTGGAHPNPFSLLVSYDLSQGGQVLEITDLVRDTNAVRPLLEKAYKISKGIKETDPLADVAFEEFKQLPMPGMVGVDTRGIRFFYNVYEIAPYAVGPGDVLLTWEQLGPLAEKAKWME